MITMEDRRSLMCSAKSLSLLPNCLAEHATQKKGVSKAIMVRDNIVTEEKSGSIFIIEDGIIPTHPNDGEILPGITKQLIIEPLHQHSIPVREKEFSEEELLHADEVIVTDTNSEIAPVTKVSDVIIGNGTRGEITKKVQMLYKSLTEEKYGKLRVRNYYGKETRRCFFLFSIWRVYEKIKKKPTSVAHCRNHIHHYRE